MFLCVRNQLWTMSKILGQDVSKRPLYWTPKETLNHALSRVSKRIKIASKHRLWRRHWKSSTEGRRQCIWGGGQWASPLYYLVYGGRHYFQLATVCTASLQLNCLALTQGLSWPLLSSYWPETPQFMVYGKPHNKCSNTIQNTCRQPWKRKITPRMHTTSRNNHKRMINIEQNP